MTETDNFTFINNLSGILRFEFDFDQHQFKNLELDVQVMDDDGNTHDLTPKQLESIVYHQPTFTVKSLSKKTITHHAPNGKFFTVKDMINVVEETERQTRLESDWFGGPDFHHIFFEGFYKSGKHWRIEWGS